MNWNFFRRLAELLNDTGAYEDEKQIQADIHAPLAHITQLYADYNYKKPIFDTYKAAMQNSRIAGLNQFAAIFQELAANADTLTRNVNSIRHHGGWFGGDCTSGKVITFSDIMAKKGHALADVCARLLDGIPHNYFQMSDTLFEQKTALVTDGGRLADDISVNAAGLRKHFDMNYARALETLNLNKAKPSFYDILTQSQKMAFQM